MIDGALPDRFGWRRRLRRDELRAGAVHADPERFAAVYERYSQALYRYCRSIVKSHDDARDALQSAMARAFSALLTEERDFELKPWLFRIAHNEAIEMIRQRQPAADVSDVSDTTGVEQTVEQREDLARLEADLRELSQRQRSALVLRELNGLGYAEIAEVLEITESVVKQAIHEARTALIESRAGRELSCSPIQRQLSDGDRRILRRRKIRAHVKNCPRCQAFVNDLQNRPAALSLLVPPLPAAASAELLKDILGGGAGSGVAVSAGVGASGGAVTASFGTGVATKLAVGTLIVAGAAGGFATVERGGSRPRHPTVGASPVAPSSLFTARGRGSAKWIALASAAGRSIFGPLRTTNLPGGGAPGSPLDASDGRGGSDAAGGPAGNARAGGSSGSPANGRSWASASPPSHGSPNQGSPAGAGSPQGAGSSGEGSSAGDGGSTGDGGSSGASGSPGASASPGASGSPGGDGSGGGGGSPGWAGPHGSSPSPLPGGSGPPTSGPGGLPSGLARGKR